MQKQVLRGPFIDEEGLFVDKGIVEVEESGLLFGGYWIV